MEGKPLSTALRSMKFMSRAIQQTEQDTKPAATPASAGNSEHWVIDVDPSFLDTSTASQAQLTPSYLPFLPGIMLGRRSFQLYNKEIDVLALSLLSTY